MSMNIIDYDGEPAFSISVDRFTNTGNIYGDLEVCKEFSNSGTFDGYVFAFLGQTMINSGTMECEDLAYMPNLTNFQNSGKFHASVLFVHEDARQYFHYTQYDKLITIPHHETWTDQYCGDYVVGYIESHDDFWDF